MKKTMLTYDTLTRFQREYVTDNYSQKETEIIEHAAYVANMNRNAHPEWTRNEIFTDFLRVLEIEKIKVTKK